MTSIQYDESFLAKIRRDVQSNLDAAAEWERTAAHSRAAARDTAARAAEFRRMAAQFQQLLNHAEGKPTSRPEPDQVVERAERAEVIAGYRELLDFLEDNPDLPLGDFSHVTTYARGDGRAAEVDRIAAILGTQAGRLYASDRHHTASREFGPVTYSAVATNVHDQDETATEAEGGAG